MQAVGFLRAMSRTVCCAAGIVLLAHLLGGCDYARMKEDEALRTYETVLPEMPTKTIPVSGGLEALREVDDPALLENPLPFSTETVNLGRERYWSACVHCHGPKADGYGTVGQSFAPLPTNLTDAFVQDQTDGDLFYKTAFGFLRHPPLAHTLAEDDIWAVIHYLRFLAEHPAG